MRGPSGLESYVTLRSMSDVVVPEQQPYAGWCGLHVRARAESAGANTETRALSFASYTQDGRHDKIQYQRPPHNK